MTVEAKWRPATRNRQPNFSFMKEGRNWVLKPRAKKKEEREEEWRAGEPCWVSVRIPEMVDH